MKKSLVDMINKVAVQVGYRSVNLERVEFVSGITLYDAIALNSYKGETLYIFESFNDLMVYNENGKVQHIVWHDTCKTLMEKAINLTMYLMND